MKVFVLNGWAASERAWDLCAFRRDRVFGYIEQLDALPEAALRGESAAVLVGWSMGGSGALRLSVRFPEKVAGLVLVAATPRMMADDGWTGMTPRRLAALEAGLRMTHGQGFFGAPEGKPNPYMMDSDENLRRGLEYLESTDLRADLRALSAAGRLGFPVHVFQSERDGIVRAANAEFLKSVFPQAAVTMVPGGEHALPITIPEAIDAAVEEVLAQGRKEERYE